jgi:hypothetical protein
MADGFACFGISPTDANAFCTIFDCAADSDCPGGWWCATVDRKPNVVTTHRSFGDTRTVCRPRQYCAPCKEDHDCPRAADGTQQHCVPDAHGSTFCSLECATTANCPLDATCQSWFAVCTPPKGPACQSDEDCAPAKGTFQHCLSGTCTPECAGASDCDPGQQCGSLSTCQPRAGTCLGDGSFCSPCRSDSDCKGGYCLYADYSTERFCSHATQGTCPASTQAGVVLNRPSAGECSSPPSMAPAADPHYGAVGCTFASTQLAPANQCVALTSISDGNGTCINPPGTDCVLVTGCWTVNRH